MKRKCLPLQKPNFYPQGLFKARFGYCEMLVKENSIYKKCRKRTTMERYNSKQKKKDEEKLETNRVHLTYPFRLFSLAKN